jgi:hypothetical protein
MLAGIHQHGMLTTPQLHALYLPSRTMRWTQRLLTGDGRHGSPVGLARLDPPLVRAVGTPDRTPTHAWFLTPEGRSAIPVARLEERPREVTPDQAAGGMQAHTLRVNDVGVAFVLAARARGDDCPPLGWRHEIEHQIALPRGKGRGGAEFVRPDALLRYMRVFADGSVDPLSRFIELDRRTEPLLDVEAKLRRYARLWHFKLPGEGEPAWRALYPHGFPEIVVVFTNGSRARLEERMNRLLAFAHEDAVIRGAGELVISCVLLEDLVVLRRVRVGKVTTLRYELPPGGGPFGPVFVRHDRPRAYVDWLGAHAGPVAMTPVGVAV